MIDKNGNIAVQSFDNAYADNLSTNPRYVKADMVSKQSTPPVSETQTSSATENLSAENETSVKLENVPNATATAPNVADTVGKSVQVGLEMLQKI